MGALELSLVNTVSPDECEYPREADATHLRPKVCPTKPENVFDSAPGSTPEPALTPWEKLTFAFVNPRVYERLAEAYAFSDDGIKVPSELETHCGPAETLMLNLRFRIR